MTADRSIYLFFHTRTVWNKTQAAKRASAVHLVHGFEAAGWTRAAAVIKSARVFGVSTSAIQNWLVRVSGVPAHDHIYHLCDRRGS